MTFEWKHSMSGMETGSSTRDYRCQGCGAKFSIYPRVTSITFIVIGLAMACAIFPLGFAVFGWLRLRTDKNNPVVPGAPRPQLKYRDGPPVRRCGTCGNPVALTKVTRHTSRGLPTGTEYEYACAPCNKAFVVESAWGHTTSLLGGLMVGAIAAAFFVESKSAGWKYGGGGVAVLLCVFVVGQTGVRIANRFRYPVVD